jgi:hypothetical protein
MREKENNTAQKGKQHRAKRETTPHVKRRTIIGE